MSDEKGREAIGKAYGMSAVKIFLKAVKKEGMR